MTEIAEVLFAAWLLGAGFTAILLIADPVDLTDYELSWFKRFASLFLLCVAWFVFFPRAIKDELDDRKRG